MDDDLICNCMGTRGEIIESITTKDLVTVEEVNETEAGTGCGSCIEDIEAILKEVNA